MEAPRRPLCGTLGVFPRVFAAGAAAAASDSRVVEETWKLPGGAPQPRDEDTGWDRLRALFARDEHQRISPKLDNLYRAALSAGIIGWVYGGIPAFIHAKKRYIEQSQAEIYHNRFDAVESAHRAATRGFIRYGWRWSWRTAVFVTLFNTVTTGLSVYQNKNALNHFVIAGAVTGSLFRINLGLRGLVAGGIIGALLGTPFGILLLALHKYADETFPERKEEDQKALLRLKLKEGKTRLQITEFFPEEIENSLQENRAEEDVKKIDALLSLPRNPSSPDKHDKN